MPTPVPKLRQSQPGKAVARGNGASKSTASGLQLESEILAVASALHHTLNALVVAVPVAGGGPVALAQALGIDKVLASRVLKALRQQDAIAALYFLPGPEPLRSLVKAADRRGAPAGVSGAARAAVDDFERLINVDIGDRSLLDSILSAWIPDARAEFELRRKQAAYKALSQLKGVQADIVLATCLLAPSEDPALMDVVWIHGLTGLHRVRPGVVVKIASRRMSNEPSARRPQTLDGSTIEDTSPPLVPDFCSRPTPEVHVHRVEDSLFYTLGGDGFGAGSAVDMMFVEVNRSELKRPVRPEGPAQDWGAARGAYFFAEAVVPAKAMQFDMVVHEALFAGQDPVLRVHDTAFEGVADVFDARRELDRLDLLESIVPLGKGLSGVRSGGVPRYQELIQDVMSRLGYDAARFRAFRCAIDYPLYGSQTSMVFSASSPA